MSLMTNEIKCYICMISCIFIEQIFIVVYTEYMYVTLTLFNYENEKKKKKLSLSSVNINIQFS